MRLTLHAFTNRVSRRIVLLFLGVVIIPLLLMVWLTLYQVRSQLEEEQSEEIRLSAKMIGMDIFQRLQYTRDEMRLIAAGLAAGYHMELKHSLQADRLFQSSPIESLFSITPMGDVTPLRGIVELDGLSLIRQVHKQRIPGKAMLLLSSGNKSQSESVLYLFIPISSEDPTGDLLGARLNLPQLFDSVQLQVRRELICILYENGVPLYCNKGYEIPWLADLAVRTSQLSTDQYTMTLQGKEQRFTAYWSLFLAPHYQVRKWSVAVAMPSELVMASVDRFQKVLIQVSTITLLLVILLSIFAIRRNMVPLEQLLEGTRRLSKGAFSSRVEINSNDEFEELGRAFNDMTVKLGNSFDQQAGLIDLSYKLQHAGILNKALYVALEALPQFVHAKGTGVIYVEQSGEMVHTESLWQLDQKQREHSASYPASQIELPTTQWQGSVAEASRLLPQLGEMGLPEEAELQLLPAMGKDSAVAYVALYEREALSSGIERLFILAQFCDILASSLSNIRLRQRLEYQALHDPLTNLPNRILIRRETEKALELAKENHEELALMIMDIDRFKVINDSMGHVAGDEILVELANRLSQFTSRRDILCRFAGDEFVFLFTSNGHSLHKLLPGVIERLDRVFLDHFAVGNRRVRATASKGIAVFPHDGSNFLDLLKHADAAMYQAKRRQPGSYAFFNQDLQLSLVEELETEQSLIDALTQREFVLHYQPCMELATGRVAGAEALVRWYHPERGLIHPDQFIRIAEMTGLIEPIGNWVMKHACIDYLNWRDAGIELDYVSVNVSTVQLKNPQFVSIVSKILDTTGMPPECLELEITETAFIEDYSDGLDKLQQVRKLGVKVAVDDFGTGYASLKYLKQLPADRIKIDRLFIKDLPDSLNDIAIVSALITLTDQLDLGLVAEGIETEAQKNHLMLAGVKYAQGFLMSRPLPEPEIRRFCQQDKGNALKAGNLRKLEQS